MMDEFRVVQKGAVTLNGHRAIVLVTSGKMAETVPVQLMHCVFYGGSSAIMLELTTAPQDYDRDRRIMENVLRTIRTR